MAFTYPPSSGGGGAVNFDDLQDVDLDGLLTTDVVSYDGTKWVVNHSRAGTLLTPQTIATDAGINLYTPLVQVGGNNAYTIDGGSALPISFDKGTTFRGVAFKYQQNLPKNGTTDWGEHRANPGWNYRVALYNSDPVTGLPTTLRLDWPDVISIPALDEPGGQQGGITGWDGFNHYVPANTPVWVTIIAVPMVWPGWEDGFIEENSYKYDEIAETFVVSTDPDAGRIRAAFGTAFTNALAPISTLPMPPQTIYQWGNTPARNVLRYVGFNAFDYSDFGGPTATDINTYDFTGNWQSWYSEWPPMSGIQHEYVYVASESGVLPIIEGQLD